MLTHCDGSVSALLCVAVGCGSHQFQSDKSLESLISELDESEPDGLFHLSWFPLIQMRLQALARVGEAPDPEGKSTNKPTSKSKGPKFEDDNHQPGYVLFDFRSWGPVFAVISG